MNTSGVALLGTDKISGCVLFIPEKTKENKWITRIEYYFEGLEPNTIHALHIHEWGDLRDGCTSAGGHFNPFEATHGGPGNTRSNRHVGDMGNIKVDAEGVAMGTYQDSLIKLTGKNSVIGRSVVLHEGEDDLGLGPNPESLRTGNAGPRLCCGIIGLAPKESMVQVD